MTGICAGCEAVGRVEHHHPSGSLNGVYLDPAVTVALCLRCHAAIHATWELGGLTGRALTHPGGLRQRRRAMSVEELRLRRVAMTVARLGSTTPWMSVLAGAFAYALVTMAMDMAEATP